MGYYPIAIDLTGKECLVVGGGNVALRKVLALLEVGAQVTVVSSNTDPEIECQDGVNLLSRDYRAGDVAGYALVFAATDDRALNSAISTEARDMGIPVNVVDDPELCSFVVPAIVRRGDLVIAITTSGRCPAISKRIRQELENRYGLEYAEYIELLGEIRERVKERYSMQADRETAMDRLIKEWRIPDLIRVGKKEEARELALRCI
jgi:siroheme synthase-like protein